VSGTVSYPLLPSQPAAEKRSIRCRPHDLCTRHERSGGCTLHGFEIPRYSPGCMTVCPHCGTTHLPQAVACSSCGKPLAPAGEGAATDSGQGTVLGVGALPSSVQTPGSGQPSLGSTLFGVAPPALARLPRPDRPSDPPREPNPPDDGPLQAQSLSGVTPSTRAPEAPPPPPPPGPPHAKPPLSKTILGVAPLSATPSSPKPGTAASPPQPPEPSKAPAARTIRGVAPSGATPSTRAPDAPLPPQPPEPSTAAPARTILGVAPLSSTPSTRIPGTASPPQPPAPPHATVPQAQTILGLAVPQPPQAATLAAPPETVRGGWSGQSGGTLLMSAQPVRARLGAGPAGTLRFEPVTGSESPPSAPPSAVSAFATEKRTLLGVARPGIAPTKPREPKPQPLQSASPEPAPQWAPPLPEPAPSDLDQPPWPQGTPAMSRTPRALWIVIGAACVLVGVGVGALWWVFRDQGPIRAQAALDAQGRDVLKLVCEKCVDGTTVTLEKQSAIFTAQQAALTLSKPLPLGSNSLEVELSPPNSGAHDRISLSVPVLFRVRGDLSTLQQDPPKVSVNVEALPGTRVVVDGQNVSLTPNGTARYEVDVSKDLTGQNAKVASLKRTLRYSLTPPRSDTEEGQVELQLAITPLLVQAPGSSIVLETADFTLAGQTQPGATLSVSGRAIPVDVSGRFAQLMNVSSVGETTILVRASAPDRAPRMVPIRVRRVESLKAEARRLKPQSIDNYAALVASPTPSADSHVLVGGTVVEARPQGYTTVLLLDVPSGCAQRPCLARVVHGAKLDCRDEEHVTVGGYLSRIVDGPRAGSRIPELHADFVMSEDR
jgi:hypothetical protein